MADPVDKRIPPLVLAYGLAGLIPFLGLPVIAWMAPDFAAAVCGWQALYGALILSFLGGARWGQAVQAAHPSPFTVSMAMLPSIAGWILLMTAPDLGLPVTLAGLAGALLLHCVWDVASPGLPAWYPRLRGLLTTGAVTGLAAGALLAG
jgi:hypothetical protein